MANSLAVLPKEPKKVQFDYQPYIGIVYSIAICENAVAKAAFVLATQAILQHIGSFLFYHAAQGAQK